MPRVCSFPPIARRDARLLIVGTAPSAASLAARRYYAHARNAFWPILGALCGFAGDTPYGQRTAAVKRRGIAIWDVYASCEREGSLDGDIVAVTAQPNDFAGFFARHRRIAAVFCNGGIAGRQFDRIVHDLGDPIAAIPRTTLPSTSPAHAGRSFAQKLAIWRHAIAPHLAR